MNSFWDRDVINFTLNNDIPDYDLTVAYETFLIRCLYFTGSIYNKEPTTPRLNKASNKSLLLNYVKRLSGRTPSYFTQTYITNVEYLANLRQFFQNCRVVGLGKNLKLRPKDIEILSYVVNTIVNIKFNDDNTNLWSLASWIGHAKFFREVCSGCVSHELSQRIDYCFSNMIQHLIVSLNAATQGELDQYIGAFMKIGLVLTPVDKDNCRQLDNIDLDLLLKLLHAESKDACVLFNKIYASALLDISNKFSSFEMQTVNEIIEHDASKFSIRNGGYSFYPGRSQDRYLSHRITSYKDTPDLHGTAMLLWAERIYGQGLSRNTIFGDIYNVSES